MLNEAGGKKGSQDGTHLEEDEIEEGDYDDEESELPDFRKAVQEPGFKETIQQVAALCQCTPKPFDQDGDEHFEGCVSFAVQEKKANEILDQYHQTILDKGYYLFKSHRGFTSSNQYYILTPILMLSKWL